VTAARREPAPVGRWGDARSGAVIEVRDMMVETCAMAGCVGENARMTSRT
jgi:hypothetical protein